MVDYLVFIIHITYKCVNLIHVIVGYNLQHTKSM